MRVEDSIHRRQIQRLLNRQVEIDEKIRSQEMEIARLRSVDEMRERARKFGMEVELGLDQNTKSGHR